MINITVKPTARAKQWLEPDGLILIRGWARDGLTIQEIAKKMKIAVSTLYEWQKKYIVISEALKRSRDIVDREVEESLYKKCIGYIAVEERAFKVKRKYYDEQGRLCEEEDIKIVEVKTFIAPDTMAIAIWLNNRKPSDWRRNSNKEKLDEKRFDHDREIDNKKHW